MHKIPLVSYTHLKPRITLPVIESRNNRKNSPIAINEMKSISNQDIHNSRLFTEENINKPLSTSLNAESKFFGVINLNKFINFYQANKEPGLNCSIGNKQIDKTKIVNFIRNPAVFKCKSMMIKTKQTNQQIDEDKHDEISLPQLRNVLTERNLLDKKKVIFNSKLCDIEDCKKEIKKLIKSEMINRAMGKGNRHYNLQQMGKLKYYYDILQKSFELEKNSSLSPSPSPSHSSSFSNSHSQKEEKKFVVQIKKSSEFHRNYDVNRRRVLITESMNVNRHENIHFPKNQVPCKAYAPKPRVLKKLDLRDYRILQALRKIKEAELSEVIIKNKNNFFV